MKGRGACFVGLFLALGLFLASVHATQINFNFKDLLKGQECNEPEEEVETVDYIIVGAGAAGCVLARRLAEDEDASVLVLEAGGDPDDYEDLMRRIPRYQLNEAVQNPTFSTPAYSEPIPYIFNKRVQHWQGRGIGGGTNIFGGIMARPNLAEIDGWLWPGLNSSVALEYFKKAETHPYGGPLRGDDGPITIQVDTEEQSHVYSSYLLDSAANAGFPVPSDLEDGYNSFGVGYTQRLLKQGERVSFCEVYLPEEFLTSRPHLELRSGSRVTQVLINSMLKAYGVQYLRNGKPMKVHAQKEVILSAGVYSSPQLLMLSGVGHRDKLGALSIQVRKHLSGVGQNYIERPRTQIVFAGTLNDPANDLLQIYSPEAITEWLATRQGPLSKGAVGTRGTLMVPVGDVLAAFHFEFANIVPLREDVAFPNGVYFFVCSPSSVESRGEVNLASADPLETVRRSPNYFSDVNRSDFISMFACINTARALAQVPPLSNVTVTELLPGDQSETATTGFILTTASSTYHAAGTCKYGPDTDSNAVVDERFRVYGVSHLRVVDASVMPRLTSINPALTIAMLAERAADLIKEDHL